MMNKMFKKLSSPEIITLMATVVKNIPTALAITAAGSFTGHIIYENQREHDVKAKKFKADDCSDIVKNASQFADIGETDHGTLTSNIVKDLKTGNEYVKKASHSRKDFVKEFMVANFLHAIRNDQPECLILQTENEYDAQFHTLSRKHPHSQDLENFIRAGRIDELKMKKVSGLEEALAADQIVGKQSDIKLANLIICETKEEFKITTIDNERAVYPGIALSNSGRVNFPTSPSTLVAGIHDLSYPSADNKSALAGDARAKEFGNIATNLMTSKKLTDYYAQVAQADINPLIQDCYRLAAHSTLFKPKECVQYQAHFCKIQESASKYACNSK